MKPTLTFLMLLIAASGLRAQSFCNSNGNIILYTNYDGGPLTISINQNISNIKIGVVSYEAVAITITGTYASNVTEIRYAGYDASNNNCGSNIYATSISGAGSASTSITFAPTATLSNTYGYGSIICAYTCNTNSYQGGCNTVDQIEHYWLQQFSNSSIYMHKVQYNCWSGTQSIGNGGTCCATAVQFNAAANATDESCFGACDGSITASVSGGQTPYTYSWSGGGTTSTINSRCPGTYTVTVTDNNGQTVTATATVDSASFIGTEQNVTICAGQSVQVGNNTYSQTGVYLDTFQIGSGCDSVVSTDLTVLDAEIMNQQFSANACDGLSVTVGLNTYTQQGTYTDTLSAGSGCDSIVVTTLNITPANLITAHPTSVTLIPTQTAIFSIAASASNFQWQEDTGSGFSNVINGYPYSGALSTTLSVATTVGMNGYLYRCIASQTDCADTSNAASINFLLGVDDDNIGQQIFLTAYPNPMSDFAIIEANSGSHIELRDSMGRLIWSKTCNAESLQLDARTIDSGIYFLLSSTGLRATIAITK